jgi:hypothetical protein
MELLLILLIYAAPILLAALAAYIYRKFINKNPYSYSRDFITGLLYLWGFKETIKNFKFRKR